MLFSGKNGLALIALLAGCLSLRSSEWPAQDEPGPAADVKLLKDAGIATDEPGLLEFFKKQTRSDSQRHFIAELIKQLGAKEFRIRERATRELEQLGRAAQTALQQARNHEDVEIAARARLCLEAIDNGNHGELLVCAVRVLSARKSAAAVPVLLAFLPEAGYPDVEHEIIRALTVLGVNEGKAHPVLVEALTDTAPLRRAAAGDALVRARLPDYRVAVHKLMQDAESSVRLRVALALLYSGDKKVVPVLIDLLPQLTRDKAWQVDDVLCRLSGGKAPQLPPGDDMAPRKTYRDECHAWWKENGAKTDLSRLGDGPLRKAPVSARARQSWANNTPDKAFDGDRQTLWNAGDHPGGAGQWIEADLGTVRQLGSIRLLVSQTPTGPTSHEIWVAIQPIGDDRSKARLVHAFKGQTQNGDVLRFDFPKRLFARYVQIRTTASPSWVAWSEIELAVR